MTYDDGTTGTVETVDDPDGLSSAGLREAVLKLQEANARPLRGSYWTLIASPAQVMALRGEAITSSNQAGWRDVTMREEGMAGNNIFYGQVGTYEGVNIIANNHFPDPNKAILLGAESFCEGVQQRCRIWGHPEHGRVAGCGQVASFRKHRLASLGRLQHFPYRLAGVHRHHDNPVVGESPSCPV